MAYLLNEGICRDWVSALFPQSVDPVMVLLNIVDGVSRLHASRRVFETLKRLDIDVPVIHHKRCAHRNADNDSNLCCCLRPSAACLA